MADGDISSKTKFRIAGPASILILFCLVGFFAFMGGWYTVDQGDRAIVLRFGKVTDVTDPGFHFKMPFMDSVEKLSIRTRKITRKIAIYSKDIQAAELVFSLNYALSPAKISDIYGQFGMTFEDKIILPQVMAKPKDVFGKYNAVDIVQNREKLTAEIMSEFNRQFGSSGIIVESVQIENIDFSDEYERSVEERMKAEVEVQKVKQNLEREKLNAEMVRTRAKGEADAKIARAEAEAKTIRMMGQAEAEAIQAKSDAITKNPNYVRLVEAEKWDGKLPQTMLPAQTLPIINVKEQ